MLKIRNGSCKYKNLDTIVNVMLTYSLIKLINVPLCILYVVVCIQTSTECPNRYRAQHFFNDSNNNEDTTTKFEQHIF